MAMELWDLSALFVVSDLWEQGGFPCVLPLVDAQSSQTS